MPRRLLGSARRDESEFSGLRHGSTSVADHLREPRPERGGGGHPWVPTVSIGRLRTAQGRPSAALGRVILATPMPGGCGATTIERDMSFPGNLVGGCQRWPSLSTAARPIDGPEWGRGVPLPEWGGATCPSIRSTSVTVAEVYCWPLLGR
jgi:hypothetical protein